MGKRGSKTETERAFNVEVGRRIAAARQKSGLSQKEVAGAAGISAGQLYFYEAGACACPPYRLRLIAARIKVPVTELLPGIAPIDVPVPKKQEILVFAHARGKLC